MAKRRITPSPLEGEGWVRGSIQPFESPKPLRHIALTFPPSVDGAQPEMV